jgi:hypothetical protein
LHQYITTDRHPLKDLFDLGEFDRKGSVRTKYGTKDEYIQAIKTAHDRGISIYADVVFNHKLGASAPEEVEATPFDPENRNAAIGEYQKIQAWTHFTFPGRQGKYSTMEWYWWHFDAVDYNVGEYWSYEVEALHHFISVTDGKVSLFDQYDYFDHANTIGWTRLGDDEHPGGMAVVLSNGGDGTKYLEVKQPNRTYIDITEHIAEPIVTNDDGWGEFRCNAGAVSVWVPQA